MNPGKLFENNFKASVPKNVYYFRIKDSPASFGQDSVATRFSLNNPFDSLLFYKSILFPIELKSTSGTAISVQLLKKEKSKMIKLHQIKGLEYANSFEGIEAGFIFDFRTSNKTYYMSIVGFNLFLSETTKKSINEKDVIQYNGFIINKHIKQVHYTYDIKEMINTIKMGKGE